LNIITVDTQLPTPVAGVPVGDDLIASRAVGLHEHHLQRAEQRHVTEVETLNHLPPKRAAEREVL
jgi:hypothetical protein